MEFFKSQFSAPQQNFDFPLISKLIPPIVSAEQNNAVSKMPSEEEIKGAVTSMNLNGAAGPDGFNGYFYVKSWDIIKSDLIAAVQNFFQGQNLPRSWTSTLIVTIPKIDNPKSFGDMRPISICNYNVKIISKIIADRMAQILPHITSVEQSGFVKGRNITDNVRLAQEMPHRIDAKSRGNSVVLKSDMAKAYDRISWLFILKVLRKFGFGECFIDMIWRILSNFWYYLVTNGSV